MRRALWQCSLSFFLLLLSGCSLLPRNERPTLYVAPPRIECGDLHQRVGSFERISRKVFTATHLEGSRIFYQRFPALQQAYSSLYWIMPLPELLRQIGSELMLCGNPVSLDQDRVPPRYLMIQNLIVSRQDGVQNSDQRGLQVSVRGLVDDEPFEVILPVTPRNGRGALAIALQEALLESLIRAVRAPNTSSSR